MLWRVQCRGVWLVNGAVLRASSVSISGLHDTFHRIDFLIRQMVKVACASSCGQSAVVLEAKTNEEVNLSVGHIDDVLDSLFGRIVVG